MSAIVSPMPTGSGAVVVHRQLEAALPGYAIVPYSPRLEWCPPLLWAKRPSEALLVHTTPDYASFVAPRSVPLIVTFHNYFLDKAMRPYSSALQRLHYSLDLPIWIRAGLRRATVVTAVSRFTADLVTRDLGFEGNIRVLPNGVDVQRFRPLGGRRSNGQVRVLFSGNLSRRKGAHWLQAIAKRLNSDIRIVCATGLRSVNRRWETTNLEFLGRVPWRDMPNLYRSVDVLLLPTVREGMALVVLEAMACGLPVVATNCSSLPEQVEHGKGGFLCEAGAVEEFAQALNRLAGDASLRQQMGEFNRARMEVQYTEQAMVARYRALFEEVLDRNGA